MDKVNVEYMKEALIRDMILHVCEVYNMSLPDAMNTVYSSEIYRLLVDEENLIYTQSTVYLNDCLDRELKFGKIYE